MKTILLYAAFFFCLFSTLVALWLGMAEHSIFYAIAFSSGFCMFLFLEKLKAIE